MSEELEAILIKHGKPTSNKDKPKLKNGGLSISPQDTISLANYLLNSEKAADVPLEEIMKKLMEQWDNASSKNGIEQVSTIFNKKDSNDHKDEEKGFETPDKEQINNSNNDENLNNDNSNAEVEELEVEANGSDKNEGLDINKKKENEYSDDDEDKEAEESGEETDDSNNHEDLDGNEDEEAEESGEETDDSNNHEDLDSDENEEAEESEEERANYFDSDKDDFSNYSNDS
ncbi:hypothetical protein FO519_004657 [Halicephalobus sp. NKZ332]|nr:hypothetical protein FO519_004657 [Halicephalobus sp. NKZ332]